MKTLSSEQQRTLSLAQCHIFDAQAKLAFAVQLFGSLGFELVNDASHPIGGDLSDLVLASSSVLELLAGMTGATNDLLVSATPAETPQDYGATPADHDKCLICHRLFLPHLPGQQLCAICVSMVESLPIDRDKDHGDTDVTLRCTLCEFLPSANSAPVDGETCQKCGEGRLTPDGLPF